MKDFCQQRSVVAKAPRKNPDNPGDTPREESAKVQGGPGQVFRHSTTLGIGGLSAAKQILGFEFRPVQLRSLNFFYTQCYLYTIQQPHPPTATPKFIHHSTTGHKNHCPPTLSLTLTRPLVLTTMLAWLGGNRRAGERRKEPGFSSKDTYRFLSPSGPKGCGMSSLKIPKLKNTSPTP